MELASLNIQNLKANKLGMCPNFGSRPVVDRATGRFWPLRVGVVISTLQNILAKYQSFAHIMCGLGWILKF